MYACRRAIFVAVLMLFGCEKQPGPTVVINGRSAVDFARNSCKATSACGADPDDPGNVQEYIEKLKAEFAAAGICQGVSAFDSRRRGLYSPMTPRDNEQLIIEYEPNQSVQRFRIMGKPSNGVRGTGTIDDVVSRTCAAARALGGKVQ